MFVLLAEKKHSNLNSEVPVHFVYLPFHPPIKLTYSLAVVGLIKANYDPPIYLPLFNNGKQFFCELVDRE
jgi:hypothetical protein